MLKSVWIFAPLFLLITATSSSVVASSTVSVESLKSLVATELPIGSTKEEVMGFVKLHHLGEAADGEGGYSPQTNAIYGIVRNVQPWYEWKSWFGFRTDIEVIFYLDTDGRLKNYTVEEVHTWF